MSIDKNIPIPGVSMARPFAFPFSEMETGDSLFHPDEKSGGNDMRRESARYSKRHGVKFVTRAVVEGGIEGCCIWRRL